MEQGTTGQCKGKGCSLGTMSVERGSGAGRAHTSHPPEGSSMGRVVWCSCASWEQQWTSMCACKHSGRGRDGWLWLCKLEVVAEGGGMHARVAGTVQQGHPSFCHHFWLAQPHPPIPLLLLPTHTAAPHHPSPCHCPQVGRKCMPFPHCFPFPPAWCLGCHPHPCTVPLCPTQFTPSPFAPS